MVISKRLIDSFAITHDAPRSIARRNGHRSCPIAEANEISNESLKIFSPDCIENIQCDALIDGRVYAMDTVT